MERKQARQIIDASRATAEPTLVVDITGHEVRGHALRSDGWTIELGHPGSFAVSVEYGGVRFTALVEALMAYDIAPDLPARDRVLAAAKAFFAYYKTGLRQ